jgi:dienelactone hydrolase
VDDRKFEEFRRRYDYARTPLDPHVIERVDTPDWTREKIAYQVKGHTVPAYLYLPKGFRPPLQVIHYAPAGDVVNGNRTLTHSVEAHIAPLIRAGRAVFAVELEGFLGRPHPRGWVQPDPTQDEYVDYVVERVTDMRRGLDYLETRPEIDRGRIALLGISAGGGTGIFVSALESRYHSVVFAGTGIAQRESRKAPAANRVNFVARITAPVLLLQGRYDEDTSLKSEAEPMFRLLHEPKKLEVYEGSHVAPPEVAIPAITRWLDQTLGRVSQ